MSAQQIFRQPSSLQLRTHFLCFLSLISPSQSDDLQILLKFKSALKNSNTRVFDTWTAENSICNFTGIVCNSNQLVKEINLSRQQLFGTLPFDSICALEALEKISLGTNFLYGGISEDLRNCTRLQYLGLGENSFSGKVPDSSSLSQLKFLNLNYSGFSGQFPWKSLENLTSLTSLSLGDNPFEISSFPLEVLKVDKLYWLYLTNCSLEGEILEVLNQFTDGIPSEPFIYTVFFSSAGFFSAGFFSFLGAIDEFIEILQRK